MSRRQHRLLAMILVSGLLLSLAPLRAQVQIGASVSDQGLDSFYLAIGDYFHAPAVQIQAVRSRLAPDEAPVVFFLAQRARVEPSVILRLRSEGQSWMDITLHFGLSPEIFYVPVQFDPGPPYGHAYGYYKKVPRARWSTIRLPDADVVNLVNLRFMKDYYDADAASVVRLRHEGKHFADIGHAVGKGHSKQGPPAAHGKGHEEHGSPGSHGKGGPPEKNPPGRGHGH